MTNAERDRLRADALRLCVDAAIAAGGDLAFPRGPIVKALLRRGAGRTFAYDTVADLVGGGEVEAELQRRSFLRREADGSEAGNDATAPRPEASADPIAASLAALDQIGYALFELADAEPGEGNAIIMRALAAVDEAEALLRSAAPLPAAE